MRKVFFYILSIAFIFFVIWLWLKPNDTKIIYKEKEPEIFIDSVFIPNDTIVRVIPHDVDTLEILQRYYTRLVFYDTLLTIDSIQVIIKEEIEQNDIKHRFVKVTQLKYPILRSSPKNTIGLGYGNNGIKAYYLRNVFNEFYIGGGIEERGVYVILEYRF